MIRIKKRERKERIAHISVHILEREREGGRSLGMENLELLQIPKLPNYCIENNHQKKENKLIYKNKPNRKIIKNIKNIKTPK